MTAATRSPDSVPVLFFDGDCGLCSRFVRFVLRRDRRGSIRYAPLQGATARRRLGSCDRHTLDSAVFCVDDRALRRSSAVVSVLRRLGFPWNIAGWLLWLVPRPLRDLVYAQLAHARQRLSRHVVACPLPTEEERERFLA